MLSLLINLRPKIVYVAGWGEIKILIMIVLSRALGLTVIAASDTWTSGAGPLKQTLKRLVFKLVSHFSPGGTRQERFLLRHGVPKRLISRSNMTVDVTTMVRFYDGLDEKQITQFRESNSISRDDVVLLHVGRLILEKDVSNLIASFQRLPNQRQVQLIIVGEGPERAALESQAALNPNVKFLGRLDEEKLWLCYAAADIFVGASVKEGWGLVVNEAMTASLPVVVTDSFGCADDLVSDETGFVVPPRDPVAMAAAMAQLIADRTKRTQLGKAGYSRILSWTIEKQAKNVMAAWRKAYDVHT
jgi:glycosyltransferase involved in cell wall biosynthesis